MGRNIVEAIQRCMNKTGEDKVFIFTGQVTDNSNAMVDGTVQVQQVTSKIAANIQPQDDLYSYNQQDNGMSFDTTLQNQAGALVFTCYLQAEVGDYMFSIPVVNSYVTVCHTTFQDPFIISFQDVNYFSNAVSTTSQNMDANGHTFSSTNTFVNINPSIIDLSVDSGASLKLDTNVDLKTSSNAELKMDSKIDLKSQNAAEITLDTLISIKNNTTSLVTLMTDIKTALQDVAGTTIPSGGGVIGTLTPDLLIQITNISTGISNLLN